MPFVLIAIGAILFLTAINGTTLQLGSMLKSDTFGKGGYIYWAVAVFIVGAIGYYKPLKKPSDLFLILVILGLLLSNGGVFAKFNQAIASQPPVTPATATPGTSFGSPSNPSIPSGEAVTPPLVDNLATSPADDLGTYLEGPDVADPLGMD
jgi:hypothetical protein